MKVSEIRIVGVKRFVYISAADFGWLNYLLQGYYEGKVLLTAQCFCFYFAWELEIPLFERSLTLF